MRFNRLFAAPLAPLPLRSRMCLCLALLLTACAAPAPIQRWINPPPADLALACDPGPPLPELGPGETMPLGDLVAIAKQREAAAKVCRARHAGLVRSWPAPTPVEP